MKKKVNLYFTMLVLMILLSSWGEKGHQKINNNAPNFFHSGLSNYKGWAQVLLEHGSDADNRKRFDHTEGIKHYIDIDAYDDFVKTHKIVEGKEEAFSKYGSIFIKKNGTLPWVTDSVYHVLVNQFKSKEWSKVLLTASDLGHYVGDGHMPLHITTNYDGKFTGQSGIHGRYESHMINMYVDEIKVNVIPIHEIKNIQRYVFDYLYNNYQYKDSLLKADKYAYEKAGHEYNDMYYQILWSETKGFTIKLINGASKSLAELITQAWVEAGRPVLPNDIKVENISKN